ncbi:hypothetical protein NSA23_14720 [Anaerosalibacter massiliensis]|uniref:O-antigen polysaccharide polymerase Wzy n=1 Tax=Anaerosalibacter massiliensis TaxID=1347392 RepID=A0A9X2MKE2_9FIRM|nr:hypothetical protein [Anaerosalibacter massiliensis]MCR2045354.1 hypothetical protein [Anaerosalibacter massiliensis]
MKIKLRNIFKLLIVLIVFVYIYFFNITPFTNKIDAMFTLILSVILLYKSRNDVPLFIMMFFIFYCNYSVVMGEYIIKGSLSVPFTQVKNNYIYGINIRIILLFMSIITIFYNGRSSGLNKEKIVPKDNFFIFYGIIFLLLMILLFGVDRSELQSYTVRISPIYEYSKLLFLFAYYFSGKSGIRKGIFSLLICLFILQDAYYGGRATSMQLIILFAITILLEKISVKKVLFCSILGLIVNDLVVIYRRSYMLSGFGLLTLIENLINSYFVSDTAVYAYYASATHVAASKVASLGVKIESFLAFIQSIFIGSKDINSNVTLFVSKNYYFNMGGGLIPTHFYFWFGWVGVIAIAFTLVYIINKLNHRKSEYQKLLYAALIFNVPRWYLYSPNVLFRGTILFTTLMYFVFKIAIKPPNQLGQSHTNLVK